MRRSYREVTEAELGRLLRVYRLQPMPPVEIRYSAGLLSWKAPQITAGITHWRIYLSGDGDDKLAREVPVGQLYLQDNIAGTDVFVSAYNSHAQKESARVRYGSAISPPSGGASVNSWVEYTLSSNITINDAVGASGDILVVVVRQAASGGPYTIAWGANFRPNIPANTAIDYTAGAYTVFTFISKGGLWWLMSPPVSYL